MQIAQLVKIINDHLAGELLTITDIRSSIDYIIDDINVTMNTKFPVLSELPEGTAEYTAIPDRYLRSVVAIGAAWRYFVIDEEGAQTSMQYQVDYETNRFYMLRDYSSKVPEEYIDDSIGGVQGNRDNRAVGEWGLSVSQGLY